MDTICVYYKAKSNYFACDFRIATVENAPIEERMLLCHDLENWDYNFFLTEAPITSSAFFSDLQQNNYLIPESGYTLTKNEFAACLYIYESNNSIFSLGFSTEMYHDERIRQEGRPFVYRYNSGEMIESDPRLLPIIPIKFKYSDCFYGLEEYKQNTIQFFPNPNNGTFNIVSENGIENIQIFDLSGQQAANLNYANTPSEIELQLQLVPGMYFVKVKSNGEDVMGKMIVE